MICNGIRNERVKLVSYLQIAYHTIILFLQSIRISNIHPVDKLSPCNEIYYPWVNYNIILSVLHANGGGYSMHLHSIQQTVNKERVLMDNEYYLLLHYIYTIYLHKMNELVLNLNIFLFWASYADKVGDAALHSRKEKSC